jgi:hypothetical protein
MNSPMPIIMWQKVKEYSLGCILISLKDILFLNYTFTFRAFIFRTIFASYLVRTLT